jgi:hypothetical protein
MQNTRSRHIAMGRDGHLELQSKNVKKINDISTWLDAFITYCSIYLTAHSNCAQDLLKHMFNVILASSMSKWPSWPITMCLDLVVCMFESDKETGNKFSNSTYSSFIIFPFVCFETCRPILSHTLVTGEWVSLSSI